MSLLAISFMPRFEGPMQTGVKTMTCRSRKQGNPGDIFEAFGKKFVLTHVMRMHLGFVLSDCYVQEGCASAPEFRQIWETLHPRAGFNHQRVVWAHCFRIIA